MSNSSAVKQTSKAAKRTTKGSAGKSQALFSDDERAAMKEYVKELKTAKRRGKASREDGERDVLEKIAEMQPQDRAMAERVHAIVTETAPDLVPRTWYGMPAYAHNGDVLCFFQSGQKFKSRYATLGFQDAAKLDDGDFWPTSYALKSLTAAVEDKIAKLVKRAAS